MSPGYDTLPVIHNKERRLEKIECVERYKRKRQVALSGPSHVALSDASNALLYKTKGISISLAKPRWAEFIAPNDRLGWTALRRPYPGFHHHIAASQIQRCWRAYRSRKSIWAFRGEGCYLMARKIQSLVRGFLGRRRAFHEVKRHFDASAHRLQALYHGFKGRQQARLMLLEVLNAAAFKIQQTYHSYLNRQWYKAYKLMMYNRNATRIQSICNMFLDRRKAKALAVLHQQQEARMHELLEAWENGWLLRRVYAYQQSLKPEQWDEGEKARVPADEDAFIETAAFLICCPPHAYDVALKVITDGLLSFPSSLTLMYLKAIICQLIWSEVGSLKMVRMDVIEEGMDWLRKARNLDGVERQGFRQIIAAIFQCAIRLFPHDPLVLLAHTVAIQSVYGFFPIEVAAMEPQTAAAAPIAGGGRTDKKKAVAATKVHEQANSSIVPLPRKPWQQMQHMAYGRCLKLYPKCKRLDPLCRFRTISANEQAFLDFFYSNRVTMVERYRVFRNAVSTSSLAERAKAMSDSAAYSQQQSSAEETKTMVNIARAGRRIVVTVTEYLWTTERAAGGDAGELSPNSAGKGASSIMPPICIYLHEEEIVEMVRVAVGGGEVKMSNTDAVIPDYIMKHLVLVTRCPAGSCLLEEANQNERHLFFPVGEKVGVIPSLTRARDCSNKNFVMDKAALRIQRIFRGYQGYIRAKRLQRKRQAKREQMARLQKILARTHAYRQHRHEATTRIQAFVRGRKCWLIYQEIRDAILIIQAAFRIFYARLQEERARRRKLEGIQATECFNGGATLSGRPCILQIKRAGLHFKLIAHDVQTSEIFIGYIYEQEIKEMVQRSRGKVRISQKDELIKYLVSQVSLVDAIPGLSMELHQLNQARTIVLHPRGPEINTQGNLNAAVTRRVLNDQREVVMAYEEMEAKGRMKQLGMGLMNGGFETLHPWKVKVSRGRQ